MSHKYVDAESLTEILSVEDLRKVWNGKIDSTMREEEITTLYWHHRLQCAPLVTLHRLARRKLLPTCILKVAKLPTCASCAFGSAHRRSWRTKSKRKRGIRDKTSGAPGSGTSCDHIISSQPGLIPQMRGSLSHEKFWGSILYCDHYSDLLFNHLISGITSLETLQSKHAYERVAKTYDVAIKSYRIDKLRFDD